MDASRPDSRFGVAALAALLAVIGVFYLATIRNGTYWGDDFAQYILHARNIVTGTPYATVPFFTEPADGRPLVVPPVFPLMIAPVVAAFGVALTPLKVELVAFWLAALAAIWWALRGSVSPVSLLLVVAVFGLCPFLWDFKDWVLSDVPLLLLVFVALGVGEAALARQPDRQPGWAGGLGLGLLIYLAYGTRTVGILVLPALVACSLIRWRTVTRYLWIASACAVVLALAQERVIPSAGSYIAFYPRLTAAGAWHTLRFYVNVLSMLWDAGPVDLRRPLFVVTSAIALVGAVAQCRRQVRSYEWFALVYVAALVAWPIWQGLRYLYPVVPLYLAYLFGGIEAIGRWKGPRVQTAVLVALVAAITAAYGSRYATLDLRAPIADTASPEAQAFFRFVRTGLPSDAVVEFPRPRALALFGERHTFEYLESSHTDADWWADLRRGHVTHITVSSWDGQPWREFIARHADCWTVVFDNTAFAVYRVRMELRPGDTVCGAGKS